MFGHFTNRHCKLEAPVEPLPDRSNHDAHGGFSPLSSAIAAPGVGSSPAWMVTRPFWGNQRTGQPRFAQLTANTWNCSPATRRTQQAVSAVLPSVGMKYGF